MTQNGDSDAAALAEALAGTLRTAEALARTHRRIDLAGLDRQVGDLCARVLDLPPEQSGALRPRLESLLLRVDSLLTAVGAGDP